MKVRITMDIDPDYEDPQHPTGVTNEAYDALFDALNSFGDDIDVEKVDA